MLEIRRDLDLAHEPLAAQASGKFRPEDLDGYAALVSDVACQIDGGHAALADLPSEIVASRKDARQDAYDIAHRVTTGRIIKGAGPIADLRQPHGGISVRITPASFRSPLCEGGASESCPIA